MSVSNTPSVTDFSGFAGLKASARANDPETIRKAAQQFEALFTQQLLKSARAANLGDDILGGGQTEFYQDMFDQQMALHLSSGKGMGLADVLVKQMMTTQGGATPEAAAEPAAAAELQALRRLGGPSQTAIPTRAAANPPPSLSLELQPLSSPSLADVGVSLPSFTVAGAPTANPQNFVERIRPHAERAARELGVPAEAILAQAALETGWGKSVPAHADGKSSFNFFGIKATPNWDGGRLEKTTHEHLGGRMQKVAAEFRSYASEAEAFDDYVSFLKTNPRYAEALRQGDDTAGFAQGLQKAGYATDPNYAAKLLKLARSESITQAGSATNERSV